jgi:hypothetical protein
VLCYENDKFMKISDKNVFIFRQTVLTRLKSSAQFTEGEIRTRTGRSADAQTGGDEPLDIELIRRLSKSIRGKVLVPLLSCYRDAMLIILHAWLVSP